MLDSFAGRRVQPSADRRLGRPTVAGMIPAATPLDVVIRFGGGEVLVSPGGEIDLATVPDLGAHLDTVVDRGHRRVILDLVEVDFMGVCGVNLIARLATRLRASSGGLTIRSPSELTRQMLTITGVGELVEIERSEQDAGMASGSVVRSLAAMRAASTRTRERAVDAALGLVVALATATITSAHSASVTSSRRGGLVTVASSDDTAVRLDGDQYATRQGPCVFAATHGQRAHVESAAEETRWPDFIPRAVDAGITSILSTPLSVATAPVGALNLYSTGDAGFGPEQQELAGLIAGHAAGILAAGDGVTAAEGVSRVQDALHAREVIAQAQGILMEREHLSAEAATARLHRTSRDADIPLRRLAADIAAATGVPTGRTSRA
jgi:anti-anti-sigma factor